MKFIVRSLNQNILSKVVWVCYRFIYYNFKELISVWNTQNHLQYQRFDCCRANMDFNILRKFTRHWEKKPVTYQNKAISKYLVLLRTFICNGQDFYIYRYSKETITYIQGNMWKRITNALVTATKTKSEKKIS